MKKLNSEIYKAEEIKNADFSIFEKDPLIQKIVNILSSKEPALELKEFLINDLKIESFIFKDGKDIDDLVNALMNVDLDSFVTYIKNSKGNFNFNGLLNALGIEHILNFNSKEFLESLVKLVNIKTL